MEWGPSVTASIMLLAALCYGAVAGHTLRRARDGRLRSWSGPLFFTLVTLFLFTGALRHGLAYFVTDFAFVNGLRRMLFTLSATAGGFSLVALIHLGMTAVWGRRRRVFVLSAGLVATYGLVLYLMLSGNITQTTSNVWGASYTLAGLSFWKPMLIFLTVPAFVASLLLVHSGMQLQDDDGRRLRLIGISCILLYGALTMTATGADRSIIVVSRSIFAVSGMLAYHAYFPFDRETLMPAWLMRA